ncbi:NUDIX hydrolase [Glaciihabitans sp. dw_435]|uniref:NUDIX domain-containing protein n=1 Tax=Glaciihabitans sp. dw_435 TaxID=2720081 RepID=UPI001BD6227F|nr:NUDIX hydrolase [Glaciihabitans sp. dw_435]
MFDALGDAPLTDEPTPRPVLESDLVFEGRVWDIRRDTFEYGGHEIVRDYVDHPGAVAVLALDERDRVLLIQQYRHPIAMREWELPAGLLDIDNEASLAAAQRELAEEVDLRADDWSSLVSFHTSPGGSNELIDVYLARGLTATDTFAREEEEADIALRWVPLDEAVTAVLDGRLRNSILMIAVLAAHARR